MSPEGEMVRKRLQCPYHRKQVKKEFDKMLEQGRISKELYDKCVEQLKIY